MLSRNLGVREGRGNIINVSSMFGVVGTPMEVAASPYTSSKHGMFARYPLCLS